MISRPDFLILGGQHEGKFWLLASRHLRHVEVDERHEYEDIYLWQYREPYRRILGRIDIDINANVRDYVMVVGDSYAQVWEDLFRQWAPSSQPELPGQRELNGFRELE